MLKIDIKNWIISVVGLVFFIGAPFFPAFADGTSTAQSGSGGGFLFFLQIFLGLAALGSLGAAVYFGWQFYTFKKEGDEERAPLAKKYLIISVISFAVILFLFFFVSSSRKTVTGRPGNQPGIDGDDHIGRDEEGDYYGRLAAAGNRAIEYYYPASNQKAVPRNSYIAITFREPIKGNLITKEDGAINAENISIYRTKEGREISLLINARASLADQGKTVVIKADEDLGSGEEKVWYTVELSSRLKKADNEAIFPGEAGDIGYSWKFEVDTRRDTSPVKLKSVLPAAGSRAARNQAIQLNFDKPLNPLIMNEAIGNIAVETIDGRRMGGSFFLSNLYSTLEFLPDSACAQNSCGEKIFCWPEDGTVAVKLLAARLLEAGGKTSQSNLPFDGLADINGNSFDGNMSGAGEGPESQSWLKATVWGEGKKQGDDVTFTFKTGKTIDSLSPSITGIEPDIRSEGIEFTEKVSAAFNRPMLLSSLIKKEIPFRFRPAAAEVFYWLTAETENSKTAAVINHEDFNEKSDFYPMFKAGIKDLYQNCYYPSAGLSCTPDIKGNEPFCCNGVRSARECGF